MPVNRVRPLAAVVSILALAASAGCSTRLELRDRGTIVPTGRISWEVAAPRDFSEEGVVAVDAVTLELEVSHVQMDADAQVLGAGQAVDLDGQSIVGPTGVSNRARIVENTGTIRSGLLLADLFYLDALGGVEVAIIDLQTLATGPATGQISQRSSYLGPLVGLRTGIRPHEMLDLYFQAQVGGMFSLSAEDQFMSVDRLEVGGRILPIDHLAIFGGYRWSNIEENRDADNESDADIYFRGPVFGAEIRF